MKSVKAFLICILLLYVGLFVFDYLKSAVFPVKNHSLVIWLKTVFLVSAGILIMKLTLEKKVFNTFLIIYISLWVIYYVIKGIGKFPNQFSEAYFQDNKVMMFYLNITQLITPFPFFFFWVLNRVFKSNFFFSETNTGRNEMQNRKD